MKTHSPRAFPWELQLPWACATLMHIRNVVPERVDRGSGAACAKGVIGNTRRGVGTSATAKIQSVSGKSAVGKRRGVKPSIARMMKPEHAMPSQRKRAVGAPKPRPRSLTAPRLVRHVVTQLKVFFPPVMRSARVLQLPRKLASKSGTLLLVRLPSGGSQRAGPRTQMALSQHLGWPQETRHRVPSCTPATISAPVRHHRATVASTT